MSTFVEALEAMLERVVRKVIRECEELSAAPADELVTMATFPSWRATSAGLARRLAVAARRS
ncbi:MAG TPA: hypothetical protein VHN14_18200 [Kofleriaceae bacterium]|jgi:hypothetical protein|nr:hypothetical protein [Kofleriaceae bacterium]